MKTILLWIAMMYFTANIWAQTAAVPAAGDGSSGNPYQIATLNNLYWITTNISNLNKYYVQTADIDASTTSSWSGGGWTPIGSESPSYNNFTGSYNGQGHVISGLFISRSGTDKQGLFGFTSGAIIQNVGLTNVNITGGSKVGALVGYLQTSSTVSTCYSTGNVSGSSAIVGGLVGYNYSSTVSNCYSTGSVTESNNYYAGGLVGDNNGSALVSNSYSTCSVSGSSYVGGLVGYNGNSSMVSNSYSTGSVTGVNVNSWYVGGLLGLNESATVNNCFSTGSVTTADVRFMGGLVGYGTSSTVNNSFWDSQTSGLATSNGGTGKTTAEMKTQSTFTNAGWDFVGETANGTNDYWDINGTNNAGYPYLSWQGYSPIVTTQAVTYSTGLTAIGNGNITDLGFHNPTQYGVCWNTTGTPTTSGSKTENGATSSLGAFTSSITGLSINTTYYVRAYATNSKGTGYGNQVSFYTYPLEPVIPNGSGTDIDPYQIATLSNLYWIAANSGNWNKYYIQTAEIDASSTSGWAGGGWTPIGNSTTKFTGSFNGQGHSISTLFISRSGSDNQGLFGYTNGATIQNVGLPYVSIIGNSLVGSLVGYNSNSSVSNCYSTGSVTGTDYTGGLIGFHGPNTVNNCYSTANVSGKYEAGGLVGYFSGGTISNCYSSGNVTTDYTGGGLAGTNYGTVNNCYSNGSVSAATGGGLVGNNNSTLNNCYSTGYVTAGTGGGLAGTNYGTVNNCFWDMQSSGQATSAGGTGKTTTEMKTQSTFTNAGWDITVWNMGDGLNNGYPYLDWQYPSGSPLPVELNSFTASSDGKNIILNWQTATEVNNYGFNVERVVETLPTMSLQWIKIGFVQGHGNSNSQKSYSFEDKNPKSGKVDYRLKQMDTNGKYEYSKVVEIDVKIPVIFELKQNFPNPFNPETVISYQLPTAGNVTLKVYNILGAEIATLVNEIKKPGSYDVKFNGKDLASGIYFYKLSSGSFVDTKKLILMK
jgi:hypothetical protein